MSAVIERSNLGRFLARPVTAKPVALEAALVAGLTLLALLIRLSAQDGILLYPDSYQFLLVTRGIAEGIPLDATMGAGGDFWSAPFYRLGYPILTSPLQLVLRDPEAAAQALSLAAGTATLPVIYLLTRLALRSRVAAIGAGLVELPLGQREVDASLSDPVAAGRDGSGNPKKCVTNALCVMSVCLNKEGDVLLGCPLASEAPVAAAKNDRPPPIRIDGPVIAGQPGARTPREGERAR